MACSPGQMDKHTREGHLIAKGTLDEKAHAFCFTDLEAGGQEEGPGLKSRDKSVERCLRVPFTSLSQEGRGS